MPENKDWKIQVIFNPLTPMSDQDRISPYSINTISIRQVMRTRKNLSLRIFWWYSTKFSEVAPENCVADSEEN